MKQMRALLLLTILSCTLYVHAIDIKPDSVVTHTMHRGIDMVEIEEYERANAIFMQCLNMGTLLPDDLAFYFGKSLFFTDYRNQSGMFLEKYLQLKDSTAQHYEEALALLNALSAVEEETAADDNHFEPNYHEAEEHDYEEDPCEGYEDVVCPICDGAGVVKKQGKFGAIFRTCKYCDDHGLMPCDDFIKYRNGTLGNE